MRLCPAAILFLFLCVFFRGCTCLKCTNQPRTAPTEQEVLSGGALVSARLCRLPEQEVHQPSKQELHQQNKRSINIALLVHLRQVHPLVGTRHPIVSVRHPIGFRPPHDQIPSAVQSDSVRCPMTHPLQSNDVGCTLEFENLIFRLAKYQKTQTSS